MFAGCFLVTVWLLAHTLFTSAQNTNATCEVSHKWALNSQKQSPCAVAEALLRVCTPSYSVQALPANFHYTGPSTQDATPCQCNTVVYSLLAECGLCQGCTATMWSLWEINCPSVSVSSFPEPIPAGLHVPGWAYFDVETSDMFDEALALANANATESTAIPQPTKTTTKSSARASASSTSASSSSASSSSAAAQTTAVAPASNVSESTPNEKHSNVVGGSVMAGFVGLALLLAFGYWIYHRKRVARTNGAILESPTMSEYRTDTLPSLPEPAAAPVPSITVSSLSSEPDSAV